jgi:hypothetical protein
MKLWRGVVLVGMVLSGGAVSRAQDIDAARKARLVVGIVAPASTQRPRPASRAAVSAGAAPQYKEQTAGSFGQTAGSAGQTAGSGGTTMANFGQTAGSVGQTAGSTGQNAGSFGGSIASKNAGDAGQTVGSFGTSTTNLAATATAANTLNFPALRLGREWDDFMSGVNRDIPDVTFDNVLDTDLETDLREAEGTSAAPDVLLGNPLPEVWRRSDWALALRFGLIGLWKPLRLPISESKEPPAGFRPEASIVAKSPNPEGARAFVLRLEGAGPAMQTARGSRDEAIVRAASQALRGLLQGAEAGGVADPEMAQFNASAAALAMLDTNLAQAVEGIKVRTDATSIFVNNGFAAVAMQAVADGPRAFGVVHAVALLRRDSEGRWLVLHLAPNLTPAAQAHEMKLMEDAGFGARRAGVSRDGGKVLGISQAAPLDGDNRSAQPEMWWDNLGGATLQVLEWQRKGDSTDDHWTISNLYFVTDANSRLRTTVTARFATSPDTYRWRVWSVGMDGNVVLSGWRTMNIVTR